MHKNRAAKVLPAIIAMMVALSACAPQTSSSPAVTHTLEPRENRAIAPSPPPDPRPEVIWPLTGADAAGTPGDVLNRPALSIKIENSADARPQINLQYADVVYEEYVEYGISRLIAVYHSDWPEQVGPIRSMRPMDQNIIGSYDGPLIFSGAQRRFINAAAASGQKLIAQDIGSYGFFRSSAKRSPHNLHGTLTDFHEQAEGLGAPSPQWEFAYPGLFATAQTEGVPITHIDIQMSQRAQPDWKWDEAAQLWMRYEDTTPHVTDDGTQLFATNVVMLWVDVRYTSRSGGSSVPETIMISDGYPGYVASGDSVVEIRWSKASRTAPVVMTTLDGDPVQLMPGNTWVELVPQSGVGHTTDIVLE